MLDKKSSFHKEIIEQLLSEKKQENLDKKDSSNKKSLISFEKLAEFDVHVGLKSNHWNPKMQNFVWKKINNRHIIDITKSLFFLEHVCAYISEMAKSGMDIMFVCVKNKNAAPIVKEAAERVNGFYLTQRWLGGLLTNFPQINKTIKKLNYLEELISNKELSDKYTKKELVQFTKEKNKLEKFYSGIKNLTKLPNLLIVVNPVEDYTAITEAKKMGIPVVALCNTNTNPDLIEFIVPGNNFSAKSVYLIVNLLCDAIAEIQGQDTLIAYKPDEEISLPEKFKSSRQGVVPQERGNSILA